MNIQKFTINLKSKTKKNFNQKLYLFIFITRKNTESYLSTGPDMTIEYKPSPSGNAKIYGPSSAFKLRYEFVDTSLGGAPMEPLPKPSTMPEPAALVQQSQFKSCDRIYKSNNKRGIFRSPSNVFMFGRGGAANISCTIRFVADPGESIR